MFTIHFVLHIRDLSLTLNCVTSEKWLAVFMLRNACMGTSHTASGRDPVHKDNDAWQKMIAEQKLRVVWLTHVMTIFASSADVMLESIYDFKCITCVDQ